MTNANAKQKARVKVKMGFRGHRKLKKGNKKFASRYARHLAKNMLTQLV